MSLPLTASYAFVVAFFNNTCIAAMKLFSLGWCESYGTACKFWPAWLLVLSFHISMYKNPKEYCLYFLHVMSFELLMLVDFWRNRCIPVLTVFHSTSSFGILFFIFCKPALRDVFEFFRVGQFLFTWNSKLNQAFYCVCYFYSIRLYLII